MSNTPIPIYQQKNTMYAFSVYENQQLVYSKYSFIFDYYLLDYIDKLPPNPSKSDIFYHFLINNDTDLNKPFSLKDEFKKYFYPMTDAIINYNEKYGYSGGLNYMQSVAPNDVISYDTIVENQFELIEYNEDSFRRLQDYIYYKDFIIYYTKYNFDFNSYQADWNIWSKNKLLPFTDFAFRTQYLNNTIIGSYGYGDPTEPFKKYFIQFSGLQDFLYKYSVTSIYTKIYNSYPNIDWIEYKKQNPDIPYDTIPQLQDYYLEYGQFEIRPVSFDQPINKNVYEKTRSIVTVEGNGTGFLYNGSTYNIVNGEKKVYLVTCYHIIEDIQNKNVINASVNYIDDNNEQISKTLAFTIIGYDLFYDLLVGLYDEKLDYNKQFNSSLNIDNIPSINIDGTSFLQKNETVYTIAHIGQTDSNVVLEGKLMDNNYKGNYSNTFFLGMPESFLINFYSEGGTSGAPLFQENNNNCIGILMGSIGEKNQYTIALSNFYLSFLAYNALEKFYTFTRLFPVYNIIAFDLFVKEIFSKKWLGTINKYYSSSILLQYPSFNNFNYDGGLVITDFIIGFNKNNGTFITNSLELDKYNAIPLNTPLLKTKIYQRFINNGRIPIVIKSILAFENAESDFDYFDFGLKTNQYGYYTLSFDLTHVELVLNDKKYINPVKRSFPQLYITYYYFNGNTWIEDNEIVGGNTPEWYNEYIAEDGRLIYQHKFEYPLTLLSYLKPYINSIGIPT